MAERDSEVVNTEILTNLVKLANTLDIKNFVALTDQAGLSTDETLKLLVFIKEY